MITNFKAVSLTEAATMLGRTEKEVLHLSQYGYLEQSKPKNGSTRINIRSLETYARRSGIALQEAPKPSVGVAGSSTVHETMTKLGLHTEAAVHRLIQAGHLKAGFEQGIYMVETDSIRNYIIGA